MDWSALLFKNIYKAAASLIGGAAQKAVGVPSLFEVLLKEAGTMRGAAGVDLALPATRGVMLGAGAPALSLNFHSAHALALFLAIRAEKKYGDAREHLDAISDAMDALTDSIKAAIDSTTPVPMTLPSIPLNRDLMTPSQQTAYIALLNDAVKHTRAFVAFLDIILDDLSRCIDEWNEFLGKLDQFLSQDSPRNSFEKVQQGVVKQRRESVDVTNAITFGKSVNTLTGHRNRWGKLLDLPPAVPLDPVRVQNR